jgi:putative ABC transport system permease protein
VSLGILLSALRWRRASAVVLFAVATAAIAAAAIGPMFVSAADDSVFVATLRAAPAGSADLLITSSGDAAGMRRLEAASSAAVKAGHGLLQAPIFTADQGVRFSAVGQSFAADLLARTAICAHVLIVAGHCPSSPGEVALSQRSATIAKARLGTLIDSGVPGLQPLKVVALYRQPAATSSAYWAGNDFFSFGTGGGGGIVQLDPLIATQATALAGTATTQPGLASQIAWSSNRLATGPADATSTLSKVQALLASSFELRASTGLSALAASAGHVEHLMREIVLTIELQVVLLSLLILFFLGRSTASARAGELELARRRGFPRRVVAEFALAEPALIIFVSLPVGILLAWVSLELLSPRIFVGGTPVSIGGEAVLAAVAGCLAALLASAAASYELWQRHRVARSRRGGQVAAAVDSAAIVLALAGLLALAGGGALRGSHTDPLASLAPGLLALGAGVLGLRLALVLIGVAVKRTSESKNVAWFLALRQIARRPSAMRQLLPLTVATALVLFAVGGYFLASSNRTTVADFGAGAAEVVDVSPEPGVDLVSAVRRADPSGHDAMAAAVFQSPNSVLLAVDASRLAAVAAWPAQLSKQSLTALSRDLTPPTRPEIVLHGDDLRLDIGLPAGVPQIVLTATVFDEVAQSTETVELGPLRPGTRGYTASLQGSCSGGCRLVSLSPSWKALEVSYERPIPISLHGVSTRSGNGAWHAVRFGAGEAGSWQATPDNLHVHTTRGAGDVVFVVPGALLPYGGLLLSPRDLPAAIPAVVTGRLEALDPPNPGESTITAQGLDGNNVNLGVVAMVPTLPLAGTNAALVDLSLAERAETSPTVYTTYQVWLSSSASPAVLARLRANGVTLGTVTRASTSRSLLDKGGLALAYDLALIVSPVALLLALGTMGYAVVAEGRQRRRELASLRLSGVSEGLARRALMIENGLVLTTVLVVGGAIGFAAAALALPSLPEFPNGTAGVPISASVPIGPVVVALAVLALALGATVALSSALVGRRA